MAAKVSEATGPLLDVLCKAYSNCRAYSPERPSIEHLASEALRVSDHEFSEGSALMRSMAFDGIKPKAKRFLGKMIHDEVAAYHTNKSGQLELDGIAYPFAPLEMFVVRNEQTFPIAITEATYDEMAALHSRLIAEAYTKQAAADDINRLALAIHGRAIVSLEKLIDEASTSLDALPEMAVEFSEDDSPSAP